MIDIVRLCPRLVRADYNNPKPQGLKNYQTLIAMRGTLQVRTDIRKTHCAGRC